MQLLLKRTEQTTGFFKKKYEYVVRPDLVVSEEERNAIKQMGLGQYFLIDIYEYNGNHWGLKLDDLLEDVPPICVTGDIAHAQELEEHIKTLMKQIADSVRKFIDEGGGEKEQIVDL